MKSIREKFVRKFGETEAKNIEIAAESHKNGIHDKLGSDPFKWALLICIGFQCMEVERFRKYHNIMTPWLDLKAWIKRNGKLSTHDGDCDFISLFAGIYDDFIPKNQLKKED